jgi:hypothetical protein
VRLTARNSTGSSSTTATITVRKHPGRGH